MRHNKLALASVVAAGALALSACSSAGGTTADPSSAETFNPNEQVTLTLTWWGNDDRASRYQEAIALFEEAYPNITVQPTFSPWDDYWTARSTEAASRSLPDVMQFDLSYMREYADNDMLLNLQPYLDNGTIDLSGFDPSLVSAGVLDEKQVAIPTSTNTFSMFTNPAILDQTGVAFPDDATYTWQDFNQFIADTTAAGATTDDGYAIYGSPDYTGTFWFFMQWLLQKGVQPFAEDGSLGFTQDDVVEFLNLTADLRAAGQTYPQDRTVALTPVSGFASNEAAAQMNWDNFLASDSADSGSELALHQIPSIEPGEKHLFLKPSMLLVAGANTEHAAAAATLINFLLTEPEVGAIFGTSKGVPADVVQRDKVEAAPGSIDAQVIAYEESISRDVTETVPIPVKGYGTIEAKWKTLAEEVAYGNLTPEDFAKQWFDEAELAMS
ncbi:ABC transporter substrate-binding protein [Actinotalea sp. M2MS4P-6]|uniref:ABC transporter substrate-binding protein n=1 Tax=Actinotalea sp. M2MS4P-6 TaxID=2983762 RepID=UPI0021E4C38A|nr:ABC transporter substrate-binding protein [Actinotalea sp. M2MS4P-6]MCV2394418.1 ABC transporter substrate-binding protein [Actinotalea sp. M2MS4P-6]